jgi:hypothetical protein
LNWARRKPRPVGIFIFNSFGKDQGRSAPALVAEVTWRNGRTQSDSALRRTCTTHRSRSRDSGMRLGNGRRNRRRRRDHNCSPSSWVRCSFSFSSVGVEPTTQPSWRCKAPLERKGHLNERAIEFAGPPQECRTSAGRFG